MVKRGDVFFRKELCTTHKSTVSLASYKGKQVAAKQLKIDQELTAEEKEKELLYLIHEVAGLWVKNPGTRNSLVVKQNIDPKLWFSGLKTFCCICLGLT